MLFTLAALALPACQARPVTVAETLPKAASASPWMLDGEVWSGTFEQAAHGLGDEAAIWYAFEPERVWLAIYRHDSRPQAQLTMRIFAFSSTQQARRAFESFRPADADALQAGDEGCWTDDGILVLWGRLVFDIFGSGSGRIANPEQAVYLLAFIERQMPADLPGAPR